MGTKSKRALAAAGLACAMAVAPIVSGTASAEPWPSWEVRTTTKWAGYGKFDHDGDKILAADQQFDGYGIAVKWRTDYGRSGVCRSTGGVANGEKVCNYNMAEHRKIKIQACKISKSNQYVGCGRESSWVSIGDGTY